MQKKIFSLLILILFVATGCAQKKSEINLYESILKKDNIIVGISFDSKPFGFKDIDGNIKGLEVDLAKEITYRILGDRNKVLFKNITPQERLNAAMSGDVDMVISTMTINPQRKKLVYFSSPYFVAGQAICVRKDSKIYSHYDLNNKRVVVILGTTGEKNIKRFAPNALVQGYTDNAEAIEAFLKGYDDAITTDDSLLIGLAMDNNDYILLPERLTKEPYGIAFKKSGKSNTLRDKVNKIIYDIIHDGTLDAIKNKWKID